MKRILTFCFVGVPLYLLALPFLVLVGAVLLVNDVLYLLLCGWHKPRPGRKDAPIAKRLVSIVIPSWNGKALLEECLPSVVHAVEVAGPGHEIIVVENGSDDGSAAFLREHFPSVVVVALERNEYFGGGCNAGARAAKNDIILFLNNDMKVHEDFIAPLLKPFDDGSVFAVSSQIFFEDATRRREETGKTRAEWGRGGLVPRHDLPDELDEKLGYTPALWLGGGSATVDKRKFWELGGFDELYLPFYVEDLDISYQAWKRGWQILFSAESKVIHKHRASTKRFGENFINRTIARNDFFFVWSNVSSLSFTVNHATNLLRVYGRLIGRVGRTQALRVLLIAMTRLPRSLSRRNTRRWRAALTDKQVFGITNNPYRHKQMFTAPRQVTKNDRLNVLLLTPYLPTPLHAGGARMLSLLKLLGRKHNISLVSYVEGSRDLDFVPGLEEMCGTVDVMQRRVGDASADPLRLIPGRIVEEFGSPEMTRRIERELVAGDYDIVQCEYVQMAYACPNIVREASVITDHEVAHRAFRINTSRKGAMKMALGSAKWLKWLRAEIDLCERFDQVVTVTEPDKQALISYAPNLDIHVVQTAVDSEYFVPQGTHEEEPESIMFLGAFRHFPNVDAVIYFADEILPKILAKKPNVKFYVVGSYGNSEIPRRIREQENVIVTDWVDDLRPYYERATVFVVPIRLGGGIRGKIQEAWCMHKAVVATPLGADGLEAQDGKNLLIADEPDTFADAVVRLVDDPARRQALGDAGRETVDGHYSFEAFALKHEAAYYDLLTRRGRLVEPADVGT